MFSAGFRPISSNRNLSLLCHDRRGGLPCTDLLIELLPVKSDGSGYSISFLPLLPRLTNY